MKILNSAITMAGESRLEQKSEVTEQLNFWDQRNSLEGKDAWTLPKDILELSHAASNKIKGTCEADEETGYQLSEKDKQNILLIEKFIEKLTGKKIKILVADKAFISGQDKYGLVLPNGQQAEIVRDQRQGWGLSYSYHESVQEKETVSFSSGGSVQTEDGRQIDFRLEFEAVRESSHSIDISIKAGDALIDPLVVNYGTGMASLSDDKVSFDLNNDGQEDNISFVNEGSGFLALDKNADGTINNGSELFGPTTGDGFAELAQYDLDKNNWIDENDAIFNQLKVWSRDSEGSEQLMAIGAVGIGAIYLGNVDTQFSLRGTDQSQQGQLQSTGVFLKENGLAGTIQHVDLVV